MRLNSKILSDLMVYQGSVFGMSMELLVKGAIGDMFGVGRCRAIRAKVLVFCHLVRNFKLAGKVVLSNAEEKKFRSMGVGLEVSHIAKRRRMTSRPSRQLPMYERPARLVRLGSTYRHASDIR